MTYISCPICGAELGTGIRCPIHGTPEQALARRRDVTDAIGYMKCKCGGKPSGVLREGRGMYRVVCMCGRSGPFTDTIAAAWAAWDADHEAVAKAREALKAAVDAIYFNDSSDYLTALWDVVRSLSPEAADLLENDEGAAFIVYGSGEEDHGNE